MKKEYYAIEKIGTKKIRYCLKKVCIDGYFVTTLPVDGKAYATEKQAKAAAAAQEVQITVIGDSYKIIIK